MTLISKAMNQKINEQIANELSASYAYLAMSCVLQGMELIGLAGWFRKQSEEEREHAMKFLGYLQDVGATVQLRAIAEPKAKFDSVVAIAEAALEHEQKVTKQIHELAALAREEKDYSTESFLKYFVDEQVEELASTSRLVALAKMAGPNLLQLDGYIARTLGKDD